MPVTCTAEAHLPCPPAAAFALATDPQRFPAFFTGCGPIPAVVRIDPHGPLAVGTRRTVHNADGSALQETVTALEPDTLHAYRLEGFRPPFAWLVRHGDAQWRFDHAPGGCRVRWSYRFALRGPLAGPLAAPLLRVFMAGAMRRCLRAMAGAVAAEPMPEAAR